MTQQTVRIEERGAVAVVTLDRPEKLNAMDEPMIAALGGYFSALADRPDVRVVILRAEGRAFCAGLDLGGWPRDEHAGPCAQAITGCGQRRIACITRAIIRWVRQVW